MDSISFAGHLDLSAFADRIWGTFGPFYAGEGAAATSASLVFLRNGSGIRIVTGPGCTAPDGEARITRVRVLSPLTEGQPSWETVGPTETLTPVRAAALLGLISTEVNR